MLPAAPRGEPLRPWQRAAVLLALAVVGGLPWLVIRLNEPTLVLLLLIYTLPIVYAVCDDWPTYAMKLDAWMRLFEGRRGLSPLVERLTRLPASVADLDRSGPDHLPGRGPDA